MKKETYNCLNCGKEHTTQNKYSNRLKYCSIQCQQDYQHQQRIDEWFKTGIAPGIKVIRKYLKNIKNECYICEINSWQGKPLVLEVEHKDGDSENNTPSNLALICPNCHSQTPTFKGKNRGKGRHARRQRYAEGKSY